MKNIKKRKKNKLTLGEKITKIGMIITAIAIILGISKIIYNTYQDLSENKKIEKYYEIQDEVMSISEDVNEEQKEENTNNNYENYIAVLKIPKIGLTKGIYAKESYMNNVNRSIQIIDKSDYPDVTGGNFILAAHSGTARISYFKNLSGLVIDDKVSIDYNGKTYKYKVVDMYDVEKTGKVKIKRTNNKTTLTLITCKDNSNKQLVVICELINEK